jgi:hypothetical protein
MTVIEFPQQGRIIVEAVPDAEIEKIISELEKDLGA